MKRLYILFFCVLFVGLIVRPCFSGYLGAEISLGVGEDVARRFNLTWGEGFLVTRVVWGSAAKKGGLQVGDVIIRWGDHRAEDMVDFWAAVSKAEPGSILKVMVIRGKEVGSVSMKLAESGTKEEEQRQKEALAQKEAEVARMKAAIQEEEEAAEQRRKEAAVQEEKETAVQRQVQAEAWRNLKTTRKIKTRKDYAVLVVACMKLNQKLPKCGEGLDYGAEIGMDSGVIYHIMEAPDSYVGHYFWSTVPRGWVGPMVEQMAYVSGYKIKGNGCSFFLNFPSVWVKTGPYSKSQVTGKGYFTSRVVVPRRRYEEVLCRFTGLEEFVNVYGEISKGASFQVVAVCGQNSYYESDKVNGVYTWDALELNKIIKKIGNGW